MRKAAAEPYRDIDFSQAKQGPVVKAEPGKPKISIRLDNSVIEAFRGLADQAGGGNYQSLINDALVAYLHQRSMLEAVRQVKSYETAVRHRGGPVHHDALKGVQNAKIRPEGAQA